MRVSNMTSPSKIFTGFRALGFTSNHVPLATRYHRKHKENYVVTCVGKAFHVYNCSRLGIVNVSEQLPVEIDCISVDGIFVYAAAGNAVYAFKRGKHIEHRYESHKDTVHLLLPFGNHLVSVDRTSHVNVTDIHSQEVYTELQFDTDSFEVTALVHPSTYINKLLFGSKQGPLQLWNVRVNKLLYTFTGWGSQVTALEQAPAVDVVAVGLADGRVFLHNLRYDESVVHFSQEWGPVISITFRTDGHPVMVTGSSMGHMAVWDLEKRKLQSQIREAHQGAVTGMQCLPSEPLLITSSPDNSVKVWIFDQPDGGARLLRERSGHSAPPTCTCYHGNDGKNILTAGQDSSLRSFSTVHDRHNKSLGRASFNKKESKRVGLKLDRHMMPPITMFASESSRQSDWDSIIACHRGIDIVTTWNYQKGCMGAHSIRHSRVKPGETGLITGLCVDVTSCGNFAVVGYSSGHADVYNMQSGLHRGTYGSPTAHKGPVRAVKVDGLNQLTITGGADSHVRFWRFKAKQLLATVKMDSQVSSFTLHRESSMLAVALDDFSIVLLDIDTRKVVRNFSGHSNSITDMTFTPDSRWLITASMDSTVRTWDLPTGRLIDCFLTDAAVTSLALSPTGDFLATTHVDDLGVYLWSNMTLYAHIALRPLPANYQPEVMVMPTTTIRSQGLIDEQSQEEEEEDYEGTEFKSPEQISDELVTLSLLPASRWQNLLHLDIIKERNKPREPPKVPKAAPFFLPTIPGLEPKFTPIEEDESSVKGSSKILLGQLQNLSAFGKLVQQSAQNQDYASIMNFLKDCGPSGIDLEFRGLSPEGGGSVELMKQFLKVLDHVLKSNMDFELAQAYLGLFLKLHGNVISSEPSLQAAAEAVQDSQAEAWTSLEHMFNQSLCLINYFKSATL